MALTDYTTFNDIRAVLGVTTDDLEDSTLSLDVYVFDLEAELDDLEPSPHAAYKELREQDPDTMSDNERRFFQAVRLFSTYSVGKQLLTSLPMFAPKEHSDGKSSMTRFALDPYKETIKRVEGGYDKMRERLINAFAGLTASAATSATPRVFFLGSGLASDPVTGA